MNISLTEEWKNSEISSPSSIAEIFQSILRVESEIDREKEHVWVVGLKTNNQIKYIELVSLGILNASLVHPREVFRMAILQGVHSVILVHNHPSGDCTPSLQDLDVWDELSAAGKLLRIPVLDSLIVSETGFCALAR